MNTTNEKARALQQVQSSGHVLDGAHLRGQLLFTGWFCQFWPNAKPCTLAEHLPRDYAAGFVFNAPRLNGIHVPATSEALIEVLLVYAYLFGQRAPRFGGYLWAHPPEYSDSLEESKRFAS